MLTRLVEGHIQKIAVLPRDTTDPGRACGFRLANDRLDALQFWRVNLAAQNAADELAVISSTTSETLLSLRLEICSAHKS